MKDSGDAKRLALPKLVKDRKKVEENSLLWDRYAESIESAVLAEVPPVPNSMLIEVANICNHKCAFCAYPLMTRPSQVIDPELFKDIVAQAYELGVREVGLHGGSEPLACKQLEDHIATCRDLGFSYIYFSTNGSLGDEKRFKTIIDSGIHSIKFSINGGDRETYKEIHGRDHFEKALENLKFVSEYRKSCSREIRLSVSFVEVPENAASLPALKKAVSHLVDEIFHVPASNQSGQMLNLQISPTLPDTCQIPFNQINITQEGFLRGCCNDYQNMLAMVDLNKISLKEAWAGEYFRSFRRRHMVGDLGGTLCHNCIHGGNDSAAPLRPELGDWGTLQEDSRNIIQGGVPKS